MPYLIILSVLVLIVFLLFVKVKIIVSYDEDFSYKLKYFLVTYKFKNKEKGKNKKEKHKGENKDKIKLFLNNFENIIELAKKLLKDISHNACIELININLIICEENAADTAILFGVANSIIYPVVSLLSNFIKIKKKQIQIKPIFHDSLSDVNFKCIVSIRLGSIIWIAIKRTLGFIISIIKDKQTKNKFEGSAVK
jgi:hypothetical protein